MKLQSNILKQIFPTTLSLKKPFQSLNTILSLMGYAIALLFLLNFLTPSPTFKTNKGLDWKDEKESTGKFISYYSAIKKSINYSGEVLLEVNGNSFHDGDISNNHPIGSISKPIVANIAYQYEKKNILSLKDKVCNYLANFCQGKLKEITIENLIKHTSGLRRDKSDLMSLYGEMFFGSKTSYENIIKGINESDLLEKSAKKELYSNLGYETLYVLLQKVSKKDFQVIIKSLESKGIYLVENAPVKNYTEPRTNISLLSHKLKLKLQYNHIIPLYKRYTTGSGGITTSVKSLVSYMRTNDLAKNKSWAHVLDSHNNDVYWHNGAYLGVSAFSLAIPKLNLYLAVIGDIGFDKVSKNLLNYNLIKVFKGVEFQSL